MLPKKKRPPRVWCPGGGKFIDCLHEDRKKIKEPSHRPVKYVRCEVCGQRFETKNVDCCCPGSVHATVPRHKAWFRESVYEKIKLDEAIKAGIKEARKRRKTAPPDEPLCKFCRKAQRRPNKPWCRDIVCTRLGRMTERRKERRSDPIETEA